jgi:uncharacterized membrane protein YphA (DoxX/SURF4 family)
MNILQMGIGYLGRVFLSIIFLFSALVEVWDFGTTEQYYNTIFTRWLHLYQGNETMSLWLADLLSWLPTIVIVSIALRFLGSFLMVLGYRVRIGAFFLLLFAIAESLIIYDFWHLMGPEQTTTMMMFFKNISIIGGLLVVIAVGKGSGKKEKTS